MNRRERRFVQFSQRRELRQASKGADPTRPLDFRAGTGGYRHNPLHCVDRAEGGVCDRPNQPGLGYYCNTCNRMVSSTEVTRSK